MNKPDKAGNSPLAASPAQEPRQWDYRLGELVQESGPKADKPQVGDKGPGCCIRMGEIRMNCKTWMGEDGMWHIHPSLEKRLLEQRESDSSPSANTPAEEPNENEEGNVVGGDDVPAGAKDGRNPGDSQGLRPVNAVGQCGNGERPAIGGQAGQDGQGGSGTGLGSGEGDKGVRFSAKSITGIPHEAPELIKKVKDAHVELFSKIKAMEVARGIVCTADRNAFGSPAYEAWVAVDARIKECSSRATNAFAIYDAVRSAQVKAQTEAESACGEDFDASCVACDQESAAFAALANAASQVANAHGDIATAYKALAEAHNTLAIAYAAAHVARVKCKAAADMLGDAESVFYKARAALANFGAEAVAACDAEVEAERKRRRNVLAEVSVSKRINHAISILVLIGVALTFTTGFKQKQGSIHEAAELGKVAVVEQQLKQGVNVDAKDEGGNTPLMLAASHGHSEVVTFLIANGAKVNAKSDVGTPLSLASLEGHLSIVTLLVETGANVNVSDNGGQTPLMSAAFQNHLDVAKFLIEKGADIKATDATGVTPLSWAASGDKFDVGKYLLAKGADMKAKDSLGQTPLLTAASSDNSDAIKYLVEMGADVNVQTDAGETSLSLATQNKNNDIVTFLKAHGAKK